MDAERERMGAERKRMGTAWRYIRRLRKEIDRNHKTNEDSMAAFMDAMHMPTMCTPPIMPTPAAPKTSAASNTAVPSETPDAPDMHPPLTNTAPLNDDS